MNIKITSDSTCDLPRALLEKHRITVVPLYVLKGGKPFRDGVDLTPADIFRYVESGGELCTTSAVTVADYLDCFGRFSASHDAVIHICIGSGFSCCYQNACIAARDFPNVFVVDSRNLSAGQGLLVLEAAELAASGLEAGAVFGKLRELTGRVEGSFLINRLDYIRKGGRCSLLTALGANILQLKPCIEIAEGRLQVAKKYRGSFERCAMAYTEDRLKGRDDILPARAIIVSAEVASATVRAACEAVKKYAGFGELTGSRAGCVISCHSGPGALGLFFLRKE